MGELLIIVFSQPFDNYFMQFQDYQDLIQTATKFFMRGADLKVQNYECAN